MSYFDVRMSPFVASVVDFVVDNLHKFESSMADCNS